MSSFHHLPFPRHRPIPLAELVPTDRIRLILHKVPAGFPSPAADYVGDPVNIHDYLVGRPLATFIIQISGASLSGIGILDGDYVVVDTSINARDGHIVVACVNGEFTAKRLRLFSAGRIELHPENEAYKPLRFSEGDVVELYGVVTGSFRRTVAT